MPHSELNRRDFGKKAALTTALGSLSLFQPAGVSRGEEAADAAAEKPEPAIAEPIPPESIPVDLLLLEVVRQLYPDRKLTRPILEDIRRDIRHELRRAAAIKAVPLTNADEPAALFAAYRGED